jgi:hypothetical protein
MNETTGRMLGHLALVGLLGGCDAPREALPEMALTSGSLVAAEVVADRPETLEDTLGLGGVHGLVATTGGYWVADVSGDRLLRLNRKLEPIAVIGRSGSGPGELEMPMFMQGLGDALAVMEMGNGRVSVFDSIGVFRRTVSLPVPVAPFDWAGEDGFVVSTPGASYLAQVGFDGSVRMLAPRARVGADDPFVTDNQVAVSREGRLVVVDGVAGEVRVFDPDGAPLGGVLLPSALVEQNRAEDEAVATMMAKQGALVLPSSFVKQTATQADGRVLVLVAGGRTFGVLFDPVSMVGTLLNVPAEGGVWTRLMEASHAVIEGNRVTVAHMGGVTAFALESDGT